MTLGRLRKLLLVITLLAVFFLSLRSLKVDQLAYAVQSLGPLLLAGLALLLFATRLFQALLLRLSLRKSGSPPLSLGQCLDLVASKGLFLQVAGGGAVVAQGWIARDRLGIRVGDFANAAFWRIHAQLASLLMLAPLPFLAWHGGSWQAITGWLFVAGLIMLMLATAWLVRDWPRWRQFLLRRLPAVSPQLDALPGQMVTPGVVGWLGYLLLSFLIVALRFARLCLIAAVVAPEIPALLLAKAFVLAEVTVILPLTPGGLGVRELALAAGGGLQNAFDTLLLIALLDLALVLLFNLAHGAIAQARLFGSTRD
ncbi:MAG: lysylphosphatidylglycerol synthase domain-containing protein [Gammaproteobacteria bacterium]|nr:lysylphosphatidylglycerol synthase domain-containing protein [Gammaproteobacteria bacterium]